MTDTRVLVTGATGFIGSHVMEVVAEAGAIPVALVRPTSRLDALREGGFEIRTATLDDAHSLDAALSDIDIIVHLAGAVRALGEAEYHRVNAGGTERLLEAVQRSRADVSRFLLVSSLAAAGPSPTQTPIDEDAEPHPATAYGRSKLAAERVTRAVADRVPISIVRPPAVYGPRDRGIFTFFQCARRGLLPRFGRGPREYSMVHGRELARGIWAVATSPVAIGKTYFVCDPKPYRWSDLVEGFAAASGRKVRSITLPPTLPRAIGAVSEWTAKRRGKPPFLTREKVNDLVTPYWTCDPSRVAEEVGFAPTLTIPEGLIETARWYRDHGWLP